MYGLDNYRNVNFLILIIILINKRMFLLLGNTLKYSGVKECHIYNLRSTGSEDNSNMDAKNE